MRLISQKNKLISLIRKEFTYREMDSHIVAETSVEFLQQTMDTFKNRYDFLVLVDFIVIDHNREDQRFELRYLLNNLELNFQIFVSCFVESDTFIPTLQKIWPNSKFLELDVRELYGLNIDISTKGQSTSSLRGLSPDYFPMRKDSVRTKNLQFQERKKTENKIQWSPHFNKINGEALFHLGYSDDQITSSSLTIGYEYKGIEKKLEGHHPFWSIDYLQNIDSQKSHSYELLWVMAHEKILNIKVTNRVSSIRMIFLETERIIGQLHFFRELFRSLNLRVLFWDIDSLILKTQELLNQYSKNSKRPIHLIGGIKTDISVEWVNNVGRYLLEINFFVKKTRRYFDNNKIFMTSLKERSFDRNKVFSYNIGGTISHAVGMNRDLRKDSPYLLYDQLEFEVPVSQNGTLSEVFILKLLEITESSKILKQLYRDIPTGDTKSSLALDKELDLNVGQAELEKKMLDPFNIKPGEIYFGIESMGGELGLFLRYSDQNTPDCCRINTPSMSLIQLYLDEIKGKSFEQARFLLTFLDIKVEELDR